MTIRLQGRQGDQRDPGQEPPPLRRTAARLEGEIHDDLVRRQGLRDDRLRPSGCSQGHRGGPLGQRHPPAGFRGPVCGLVQEEVRCCRYGVLTVPVDVDSRRSLDHSDTISSGSRALPKRSLNPTRSCSGQGRGWVSTAACPTFAANGFWRAYPPYERLGLDLSLWRIRSGLPEDPTLAWGFYGHRMGLYRQTTPHPGFSILGAGPTGRARSFCFHLQCRRTLSAVGI